MIGEIDRKYWDRGYIVVGIKEATFEAMRIAMYSLITEWMKAVPECGDPVIVLIDGPEVPSDCAFTTRPIIRGDNISLAIAAASIVAKVARDTLMIAYDIEYPGYGFARHRGYGTKQHMLALQEHGPCSIHRRSVRVVRRTEKNAQWSEAWERGAPWHELQRLG